MPPDAVTVIVPALPPHEVLSVLPVVNVTVAGCVIVTALVTLRQLVPGTYQIRITVPAGPQSIQSVSIVGSGTVILAVLGLGEMITILLLPILGAAAVWRAASNRGAVRRVV